jgi:hypothetical protein
MNSNPSGFSRTATVIFIAVLVAPVLYLLSVAPLTRLTMNVASSGSVGTMQGSPEWLQRYRTLHDFVAARKPLKEPLEKYRLWWLSVRPNFITIYGQVLRQGRYELAPKEKLTVSGALMRAGGSTKSANDNKVKVIRKVKGTNVSIMVNMRDIMAAGATHLDIPVHPGDVIIVAEKLIHF